MQTRPGRTQDDDESGRHNTQPILISARYKISFMAQLVKEKGRVGSDQRAILKDQEPPVADAGYVRDVMARFDLIDFDECRPSSAGHRKLQAKKN